jgi:hypothetical protein
VTNTERRYDTTKTAIIGIAVLLTSCTTPKVVEVETVRTDTCYISRQQRDSIWLHDSVHVKEFMAGDTVYVLRDRWKTKYVERQVHGTCYGATHDTVPQPYPVEVEVPAPLSWWQRLRMQLGGALLLLLAGGVVWRLVRARI